MSEATAWGRIDDELAGSLLEQRTLLMGGVLDEALGNRLCTGLMVLSARDPRADVHLWISSPGGSVPAMLAIRDVMTLIPNDVSTLAMGIAASAGQFLLSAGAKGKRFALPHSRIMMHQPLGGVGGSASIIAIQAEQMLYTKKKLQELISLHTGQSVEQIERDSDRERWFSAEEAKEYGFVDHVVRSARQVPTETTAVS